MKNELPVLLLTGYLGSGKTTLLNRILSNERGIKFAVIVNDIGEVNIDADLIQKGGVVDQKDDSLVALQNGCICCTLKMDLVEQIAEITAMQKFDYLVIEASGICEPQPIAQTICSIPQMEEKYSENGVARLDCIVSVVDALRMRDEFGSGLDLLNKNLDEDDIENLVIQQIEFCNIVLLNKASEVSPEELGRVREIIRALNSKAEIIECDYGNVELTKLLNTNLFDFNATVTSATWVKEVEKHLDEIEDDDEDEEHEHHHHHHHDEDEDHDHDHHHHHHHDHPEGCTCGHCHHNEDTGEAEEYGIGTYVYVARRPMNINLFDDFVARRWPKNIIRAKGLCYFADETHICYVFEQAGKQVSLRNAGQWYATMPEEEFNQFVLQNPDVLRDWDQVYGDRMQKIVFIGQHLDRKAIKAELDACLIDL
ncbi:MAG: GTP-binding protein [Prevotella sp.]